MKNARQNFHPKIILIGTELSHKQSLHSLPYDNHSLNPILSFET